MDDIESGQTEQQEGRESALSLLYPEVEAEAESESAPVVEAEAQGTDEPAKSDEPPAEEQVDVSTLEELAEVYELDPEWLQNLSVTQKVNGEAMSVKLADALATHRKVTAADDYLAKAKERAKSMVEETEHQREAMTATIATLGNVLSTLEAEIERDAKEINWAKLREDDPADYSAKKLELNERRERLQLMKAEASDSVRKAYQQGQEQLKKQMEERLPDEHAALLERVPEWGDTSKAAAEQSEVVKYLTDDGFTQEDIKIAAFNGKLLAMAVKAMRYDKGKSTAETAKQKVLNVPKRVMKPGTDEKPKPTAPKDRASVLYGTH